MRSTPRLRGRLRGSRMYRAHAKMPTQRQSDPPPSPPTALSFPIWLMPPRSPPLALTRMDRSGAEHGSAKNVLDRFRGDSLTYLSALRRSLRRSFTRLQVLSPHPLLIQTHARSPHASPLLPLSVPLPVALPNHEPPLKNSTKSASTGIPARRRGWPPTPRSAQLLLRGLGPALAVDFPPRSQAVFHPVFCPT